MTGEPGVGKTQILDAASHAPSEDGTRLLYAAGIQFEAEMSLSGPNQVRLLAVGSLGLPELISYVPVMPPRP